MEAAADSDCLAAKLLVGVQAVFLNTLTEAGISLRE
jgi:hypothetical protein